MPPPFDEPEPLDWERVLDELVPLGVMVHGPDEREDVRQLIALGAVVRSASQLDHFLRMAYVALTGDKEASITAGGQMTGWLVTQCEALMQDHEFLDDTQREHGLSILARAKDAAFERHRLVHDVWAMDDDGPTLIRSVRGSHHLEYRPWTTDQMLTVDRELSSSAVALWQWTERALPDTAYLEPQLRFEESANPREEY